MNQDIFKKIISRKRKTALAKLKIKPGKGNIFFNHLPHTELPLFFKLALTEPLRIYQNELGNDLQYDFHIKAVGGGKASQIQAARLALANALLFITESDVLKKAFVAYDRNMVVPDARRKEANKPGDSAPRSKRQKSYR